MNITEKIRESGREDLAVALERFDEQADLVELKMLTSGLKSNDLYNLGSSISQWENPMSPPLSAIEFLIKASRLLGDVSALVRLLSGNLRDHILSLLDEIEEDLKPSRKQLFEGMADSRLFNWTKGYSPSADAPFANPDANEAWLLGNEFLTRVLERGYLATPFYEALSIYKTRVLIEFIDSKVRSGQDSIQPKVWKDLFKLDDKLDGTFVSAMRQLMSLSFRPYSSKSDDAIEMMKVMIRLNVLRDGRYREELLEVVTAPELAAQAEAAAVLLEEMPEIALQKVAAGMRHQMPFTPTEEYKQLLKMALEEIGGDGGTFLLALFKGDDDFKKIQRKAIKGLCGISPDDPRAPDVKSLVLELASQQSGKGLTELWERLSGGGSKLFESEFRGMLTGKSKLLREVAANHIANHQPEESVALAKELMGSKKAGDRLGAVALMTSCGEAGVPLLREADAIETSKQVHEAIEAGLANLGAKPIEVESEGSGGVDELLTAIKADRHLRAPRHAWLELKSLQLKDADGRVLPEKVLHFLIQKQSKHKAIEPAEAVVDLLGHLDHSENRGFALALLKQWVSSDQAAADRWVLTLAGLLGDSSVVPTIAAGIHRWCKTKRKELAVCGVRSLTLLGTDEALMVLNDVALRYVSKNGIVGRAAAEAFQAAAIERGLELEELRDQVVPTLGFDVEGILRLECEGSVVLALLQPDLSLRWKDPESGRETKNPASKLSAAMKSEIKELRALLKEALKSQTARLELVLVCQRRWPIEKWRTLFEEHVLMAGLTTNLIWGLYDKDGQLLRCFRRYPNGILADAAGNIEELAETDAFIGLVHPIELDEDALIEWREHLSRMKATPPFSQLKRPRAAPEPLHLNRRQLTTCKGKEIAQGTLFSRSEKLGWHQGSVVEGGELCSLYKIYDAAKVEVILELSGFFMGGGYDNDGSLGRALFVKKGSVARGGYVIDVPSQDDPNVLAFGDVPAIVYSETVADLKMIIGEVKA
ncbi:DUF4132 domain-containing protein [Haloferula chungangensis]|uniref:DUF4132 domain-containing protein n=1 Tax=Haloferula chungangensis TaxID=1048331 RepID=A0ABW2L874_9BACT